MLLADYFTNIKRQLSQLYDQGEAQALAKYLLMERLQCTPSEFTGRKKEPLGDDWQNVLDKDITLLLQGKPVQQVLGYAWFCDLKLTVNEHVLIPRPETEELVEHVLSEEMCERPVVLDLCTGSGCIALAVKYHRPDSSVFAADVSEDALEIARMNGRSLQSEVIFFSWDLLKDKNPRLDLPLVDVLVSNPPYALSVEKSDMGVHVLDHEPHLAIFVPDDNDPLVFYKRLGQIALSVLKPGGIVWVEANRKYTAEIVSLFTSMGLEDATECWDLSGHPRFVRAQKSLL